MSKCPRCCPLPGASTAAPPRRPDHPCGDQDELIEKNTPRKTSNFSPKLVLCCRNSFTSFGIRELILVCTWRIYTPRKISTKEVPKLLHKATIGIPSQPHLLSLALVYLLRIAGPVVVSCVIFNHSWSDNFEQVLYNFLGAGSAQNVCRLHPAPQFQYYKPCQSDKVSNQPRTSN